MMRRTLTLVALAGALLATELAAQAVRNPGPRQRQLQEQVFRRFVDVASQRLELREDQRDGLRTLLREGQSRRQQLRSDIGAARRELARLVREDGDGDAIARQLERVEALRRSEFELWQREQDALRELLTPRQHAEFLMLQMQLNDRVRELQRRRGGGGPPGGSPGGRPGGPPGGPPF